MGWQVCLAFLFLLPFQGPAQVVISEFMADNESTIRDNTGQYSDWIEVSNVGATSVNLLGWGLTDSAGDNTPWLFPSTNLPAGATMVVFASGLDRRIAGTTLHTDFKLSADGEYLALLRPDKTVATEFSPAYPTQIADVSYGYARNSLPMTLVTTGTVGRVMVPVNAGMGSTWTSAAFDDTGWARATNGIGYEQTGSFSSNYPEDVVADAPLAYWRLNEAGTNKPALNQGSLGTALNGSYMSGSTNTLTGPRPPEFSGFETMNYAARTAGGGYIEAPYDPALNPDGPFTVEVWINPDSLGSTRTVLSSQDRTSGARRGYVIYQSAQWEFLIGDGSGYVASVRAGSPVAGVWTHLVGVYSNAAASLYVNGELLGTVGCSRPFVPNTTKTLRLGNSSTLSAAFTGLIDEVAVFGSALTEEEVAQRYEIGRSAVKNYAGLIHTDVATQMLGANSSAYLRLPFFITNVNSLQGLLLSVKYNDGFAAFLNGEPVARVNAPASLEWNSAATGARSASQSQQAEVFDISGHMSSLLPGSNVLSLHGLNVAATNNDFLLLPHLIAQPDGNWQTASYFTSPTPGALNQEGMPELGPILSEASHAPNLPGTNDSITVTCRVAPALSLVNGVNLHWRVMYGPTYTLPMYDDGLHSDGAAGDGIYGATIPHLQGATRNYSAGQMLRWYITATDTLARESRLPLFFPGTATSEYRGTVIEPGYVTSQIPIIHLFVENYANGVGVDSSTKVGGPASVYYDGEFYDNVHMYVRGNSTRSYLKKSHSINFNSKQKFRHPGPGGARLGKTSFTADYPDPAYIRQRLTFWLCEQAGAPGPFYHPVRLQMNGRFYQLANHNDLHGEQLLERLGRDPNGALYNAAGTIVASGFSTGGFDKKTRQWEGNADYVVMANAISESLPIGTRQTNIFDLLDLAEVISYMTVARFVHENDDVWANMSVYHDNDGDGLWRMIPFDMNLSWGAAFVDSSVLNGLQVTNDAVKGHPLYGSSQTTWVDGGNWNRLYDVIFTVPQTRAMFLRHLRTFLDTWIKPPGDPTSVLEPMILKWRDEIAVEAALDRAEWGWPAQGGQCNFPPGINLNNGVSMILNEFLPGRRAHFYGKHSVTNTALPIGITKTSNAGIPLPQLTNALVSIANWDYNPVSGNQEQEYVSLINTNNYAVDLTGWRITGGIQHRFKTGTVIPAGGALYLSPNVAAFLKRPVAPRGGMSLLVQGNYSGKLSAWGDAFQLVNPTGVTVSVASYTGNPSPAQQFLRVTEIMYNPAGAPTINSDAQQFEYIELKNISSSTTLSLANVRFASGITFNFSDGTILSLAPGGRVLVVRNTPAFTALYGAGLPIAGQFVGALNNGGEKIRLDDAVGEKILEFNYSNLWYPTTDGAGFSLVIVNENAEWSSWGEKASWRASGRWGGSPGLDDPPPLPAPPVRVNEVLAHSDAGQVDFIELHNLSSTNVNIGGWFITDDLFTPTKHRIPEATWLPAHGFLTFTADQFGVGSNAFGFSEYGEGAYVFEADVQGVLSGFWQGFEFGASPNGTSFGRYVTSQGKEHFVLQSALTPLQTNGAPRVGPIIINEIMYAPQDTLEEFIELQNISSVNVPLFCTFTNEPGYLQEAATNTWHIRGGISFDFPNELNLSPGQRLVLTGFDPSTNSAKLAAFQSVYNIPAGVPICGPWDGKLNNSGESIELLAPDKPDVVPTGIVVPYVLQERIDYEDTLPWPPEADGSGGSLQRTHAALYGNDPANWFAASPTAGKANLPEELVVTTMIVTGSQATLTITSIPGRTYFLEYKDDLSSTSWTPDLPGVAATGDSLTLTNAPGSSTQRFYRVRAE